MKRLWLGWTGIALSGVLLLGACTDDDSDDRADGGDGTPTAGDVTEYDREITVQTSDELRFEPDTIRLSVGERVRLVLNNEETQTLHDFSVHTMPVHDVMMEGAEHGAHGADTSEFALHVAAEPGEHGVLMFTAMEAGEYEYFCSVPGHADAGMKGTIIVEG